MRGALAMFKVGIGPSSSHTMGPMLACARFVRRLEDGGALARTTGVGVDFHGSLSLAGRGHLADRAAMLGLAGYLPESVPVGEMAAFPDRVRERGALPLAGGKATVAFDPERDIRFRDTYLPLHENGMRVSALGPEGEIDSETYYSVGGGEVLAAGEFGRNAGGTDEAPHLFASAEQVLERCETLGLSIADLARENETVLRGADGVDGCCRTVWRAMRECMERGLAARGVLPGPLRVLRRAPGLRAKIQSRRGQSRDPFLAMDWVNAHALAASEENAAGGRVVTAPTNGACGIVPAVLAYYGEFVAPLEDEALARFLLTAGAIGQLFRTNASISGAEVGCQGEVGVACSMAAAGLAELSGGDPAQVCGAAEIAMEHNLGLTCDPVGGQVQIPCIERNAVNAVKAINASRLALDRVTGSRVSLDNVIEAMLATGKDMNIKYRETARGGLAAIRRFSC